MHDRGGAGACHLWGSRSWHNHNHSRNVDNDTNCDSSHAVAPLRVALAITLHGTSRVLHKDTSKQDGCAAVLLPLQWMLSHDAPMLSDKQPKSLPRRDDNTQWHNIFVHHGSASVRKVQPHCAVGLG